MTPTIQQKNSKFAKQDEAQDFFEILIRLERKIDSAQESILENETRMLARLSITEEEIEKYKVDIADLKTKQSYLESKVKAMADDISFNHDHYWLCKASGYRIINGRVDKDNSSNFTCFTTRGNSVVDSALLRHDNFAMVDKLRVGELCELLDHSPFELSIKSSNNIIISESQADTPAVNWPTNDENKLYRIIKVNTMSMMLQH